MRLHELELLGDERVMVVDDEAGIRRYLTRALEKAGYEVEAYDCASAAFDAFDPSAHAVILADLRMPGHDGLWLLEQLRERDEDVSVVMVTGSNDVKAAVQCLTLGAINYVLKPVDSEEIQEVVSQARANRRMVIENRVYREELERLVEERTASLHRALRDLKGASQALESSYRESIYRLSAATEYRDEETGNHVVRIGLYAEAIARRLGCDEAYADLIRMASPMHDIGKIGIPDRILLKPGSLTVEEFEEIKAHTTIGASILAGSESRLMQLAESIALTHHEWWDGSGYPKGLSGEDIPLEGRIVAVADVFDALVTERVYKKAMDVGVALDIMKKETGTHFDPRVSAAFHEALDEILETKTRYDDQASNTVPLAVGTDGATVEFAFSELEN